MEMRLNCIIPAPHFQVQTQVMWCIMKHIVLEVIGMQQFSFLLPPLLGLFVGYVTNSLAVRMLFRPYRALYLWKLRIPFTPGVIPQRQKISGWQWAT